MRWCVATARRLRRSWPSSKKISNATLPARHYFGRNQIRTAIKYCWLLSEGLVVRKKGLRLPWQNQGKRVWTVGCSRQARHSAIDAGFEDHSEVSDGHTGMRCEQIR